MSASAAGCSEAAALPLPRWLKALILFCWLFAVCRHLPTALAPELTGYLCNHDEAAALDLARHAAAGQGLVTSSLSVQSDLSRIPNAFPLWPPGVPLLLWATIACGLPLALAYKIWHLSAVALGAAAWLWLARAYLRPGAMAVFALAIALAFSDPWEKIADLLLWALLPLYLACILAMAERGFQAGIGRAVAAAAAILALAAWLTHIAVYLPVACGLSLALFAMPPNRRQLACLIALGGCGSISYCLAQYTIMVMAGHGALGLFVAGCHLAQIPLANHEAIFVKFFGDLFGLESFFSGIERLWASPPAWLHAALALGKIALAAAIVRLAFLGWRRRRPTGREIYLLLAASCHAGVLAAIIVFLEIRYAMPLLPNLWEPARLMRHLAPLLSLAWLILIQPTGALSPFASACRPRLSSALVLACSLAVGFTALFAARLMKIACGAGQAQPLRLLIERKAAESALPFPSGFAAWQACTAAEALTPRVIFAVNFPPFVAAGENAAIPPPLARLARIGNTQRVFVAVVTAGPAALSSPAAQQRQRQARQMIAVLNLPWLHTCQNGEEVYGRWVDAFAPGALADAAAAVSQEFSAPRRSER